MFSASRRFMLTEGGAELLHCRARNPCLSQRSGPRRGGPAQHAAPGTPAAALLVQPACWLAGSAVCDESNLTGEAMPVQKYACPNDTAAYDPGHGAARHTLFAGTTVLQAGISSDAAVHAVVTATGGRMARKKGAAGIMLCCSTRGLSAATVMSPGTPGMP